MRAPTAWIGIAVSLGILLTPTGTLGLVHGGGTPVLGSAVSGTACAGALSATQFVGALRVLNGYGPVPAVVNRTAAIDFYYQENITSLGHSTLVCAPGVSIARTGAQGTFRLSPSVPNGTCSAKSCTNTSGPYGPVSFRLVDPAPTGDLLRVALNGTNVTLTWTAAVASAAIDPRGPQIVSARAPAPFRAEPIAGDGGPSPANLTVHWVLRGPGWGLGDPGRAMNATATADDSASVGSLSLFSNGSFGGSTFPLPPFIDALQAFRTTIDNATIAPVRLDAGQPVDLEVDGSGASGYRYSASVSPGTGDPPIAIPCTAGPVRLDGSLPVHCAASLRFASAGSAQPMLGLTNGYSADQRGLGNLSIGPALGLSARNDPALGYTGHPIAFDLAVLPAAGTPPYGPACLDPGDGSLRCSTNGSGSWSIPYTYDRPGSFSATLSLVDGVGANSSLVVPTLVADSPGLSDFLLSTNQGTVRTPETLRSDLTGGLLPAVFWWNDSDPLGTISRGLAVSDGPLTLSYEPRSPGIHTVTLTVVDEGGTREAVATTLSIGAGPAVAISSGGLAGAAPMPAGSAQAISLRALDASGATASGYSADGGLAVSGPSPVGNFSLFDRYGRLLHPVDGTVPIPSTEWVAGWLNLSFSTPIAGPWRLHLLTPSLPGYVAPDLTLEAVADAHRSSLHDPTTRGSDPRDSRTLWRISDPFGNPILSGYVIVRSVFPSATVSVEDPVLVASGGVGTVWVNFTGFGDEAGTVYVLDAYGDALLAPIGIPAAPSGVDPWVLALGLGLGVAAAASVGAVQWRDRRRSTRRDPTPEEGDLERAAAGRSHVLRRLSEVASEEIGPLSDGWTGPEPPPSPGELADWVGALVAEGSVRGVIGASGRPRYSIVPPAEEAPRVTLDDEALEQSLRRRRRPAPSDDDPSP